MKKKAEQLKQEYIDQLTAAIRDLKQSIDEKHQRETTIHAEMDAFMAQYSTFIHTLDGQRRELEDQVRRCRYQIEHFYDKKPSAQPETRDDVPSSGRTDTPESSRSSNIDTAQANTLEEKQRVRNYFAFLWHPDMNRSGAHPDNMMAEVNDAFKDGQDAAEMLTTIPWHPVWVERQESETIEKQWGRLVEWKAYLEIAEERLIQRLGRLSQDGHYLLYQEWKAAANKRDYLTSLVSHERTEIQKLEKTLTALHERLSKLEQQQAREPEER